MTSYAYAKVVMGAESSFQAQLLSVGEQFHIILG